MHNINLISLKVSYFMIFYFLFFAFRSAYRRRLASKNTPQYTHMLNPFEPSLGWHFQSIPWLAFSIHPMPQKITDWLSPPHWLTPPPRLRHCGTLPAILPSKEKVVLFSPSVCFNTFNASNFHGSFSCPERRSVRCRLFSSPLGTQLRNPW